MRHGHAYAESVCMRCTCERASAVGTGDLQQRRTHQSAELRRLQVEEERERKKERKQERGRKGEMSREGQGIEIG